MVSRPRARGVLLPFGTHKLEGIYPGRSTDPILTILETNQFGLVSEFLVEFLPNQC